MVKGFAAFLPLRLSLVHTALSGHQREAFSVCTFQERILWLMAELQWKQWISVIPGFSFFSCYAAYTIFTCWCIFKAQTNLLLGLLERKQAIFKSSTVHGYVLVHRRNPSGKIEEINKSWFWEKDTRDWEIRVKGRLQCHCPPICIAWFFFKQNACVTYTNIGVFNLKKLRFEKLLAFSGASIHCVHQCVKK